MNPDGQPQVAPLGATRMLGALAALAVMILAPGCASRPGFYPIGIYSVPGTNDFEVVKDAGFNLVRGSANRGYLDAAHAAGLKILAAPGSFAGERFDAARARRIVKAVDTHPALWAWYVIDEPDLNRVAPAEVRRANRFLKQVPAKKPTALVLFQGAQSPHYTDFCDILMIDRYPVPWLPLANFPQHVRMARFAAGPKRPLIAVIQAFDWSQYPDLLPGESNLRPPSRDEIRCMTYCALAQRADGLFYYCFDDGRWKMEEHPAVWGALRSVVSEVNERLPLFQAEHLWWPVVHNYNDPDARFNEALDSSIALAFLRVRQGNESVPPGDYFLAVNTTSRAIDYRFLHPLAGLEQISVLGESRPIPAPGGWIHDHFPPYAVRVYGPVSAR